MKQSNMNTMVFFSKRYTFILCNCGVFCLSFKARIMTLQVFDAIKIATSKVKKDQIKC